METVRTSVGTEVILQNLSVNVYRDKTLGQVILTWIKAKDQSQEEQNAERIFNNAKKRKVFTNEEIMQAIAFVGSNMSK